MPKGKSSQPADLTPEQEAELAKMEAEANAKAASGSSEESEGTGEQQTPSQGSAPEKTETSKKEGESAETPETPQGEEGKTVEEPTDEEFWAALKPKGQERFRKLSAKAKRAIELENENERLKLQLEAKNAPPILPENKPKDESGSGGLPWDLPQDGEGTPIITREQYEKNVNQKAQGLVNKAIHEYHQKSQELQTLHRDIDIVEVEFPELNPGKKDAVSDEIIEPNPDFNEKLAVQIVKWYRERHAANPSLRLVTFVRELMSLRNQGAEQGKREISAEVAKQAANQAIVPSGAPSKGSTSAEQQIKEAQTLDELEKAEQLLPHA